MDARGETRDGEALGQGDAEESEAAEEEEEDPCFLGTCSCKIRYVPSGKPVPRDAFAMSIRDKYR